MNAEEPDGTTYPWVCDLEGTWHKRPPSDRGTNLGDDKLPMYVYATLCGKAVHSVQVSVEKPSNRENKNERKRNCSTCVRMDLLSPLIEAMAKSAHNAWLNTYRAMGYSSRKAEWGEEFMVPYDELSEVGKEFDRTIMRAILRAFKTKGYVVRLDNNRSHKRKVR